MADHLHVAPLGDLIDHDTATTEPDCACGPRVERWEDIRHLRDFRLRTMPPEHPLYRRLAGISWDEGTVARLNEMRAHWQTHTQSGAPKSPAVAAP